MESLDKAWILHGNVQNCEQFEKTPNTLGLKNMAGVFILGMYNHCIDNVCHSMVFRSLIVYLFI